MKIYIVWGGMAVCIFVAVCMGLVRVAAGETLTPESLASQILDDVIHHKPLHWRELRGREDVLVELKKRMSDLNADETKYLLEASLNIGRQEGQCRWILSSAVTSFLVDTATSAKEDSVRDYASELLVKEIPDSYIRIHAASLIEATEKGKLCNALLLGKTGAYEAQELLKEGGIVWRRNETSAKAALAKLGDVALAESFIGAYRNETDPGKKAALVNSLGYIGDAACVLALAKDIRTPIVYDAGGVQKSLRIDIISALGKVYPMEPMFWPQDVQGNEEINTYYDTVEAWLRNHIGVTWSVSRPEPMTSFPLPTPMP